MGAKRSDDDRRHQPSEASAAIEAAHRWLTVGPTAWLATNGFADVTPAMVSMIVSIEAEGLGFGGLRQGTGTSKQAVSQIVAELRKRGYVSLEADESDARHKSVPLTEKGAALRTAALQARAIVDRAVADTLGDGRAHRLVQILHELTDAVAWVTAPMIELPQA